jgi:putative ABC transport system permease protein
MMAYAASRRTQEIGVRMALGAQPRDVLRSTLGDAARLAVMGLVGGACAIALSRLVANLLYGVSTGDLVTYVGVVTLLGSVALIASYVPASRLVRRPDGRIKVRVSGGGARAAQDNQSRHIAKIY